MSALHAVLDQRRVCRTWLRTVSSQLLLVSNANASRPAVCKELGRGQRDGFDLVVPVSKSRIAGSGDELAGLLWKHPAKRIRIATSGRSPIIAHSTNLGPGPVELAVEPAALEVVQAS